MVFFEMVIAGIILAGIPISLMLLYIKQNNIDKLVKVVDNGKVGISLIGGVALLLIGLIGLIIQYFNLFAIAFIIGFFAMCSGMFFMVFISGMPSEIVYGIENNIPMSKGEKKLIKIFEITFLLGILLMLASGIVILQVMG